MLRRKFNKVRLTGLAAANATGEKLSMFVIGKSAKPRCFKNVKNLPCRYRSQNKSWMDGNLLTEWVRQLDNKSVAEGRKIALVIDNCPAHPGIDNLLAVELIFLPPNRSDTVTKSSQSCQSCKEVHRKHRCKERDTQY